MMSIAATEDLSSSNSIGRRLMNVAHDHETLLRVVEENLGSTSGWEADAVATLAEFQLLRATKAWTAAWERRYRRLAHESHIASLVEDPLLREALASRTFERMFLTPRLRWQEEEQLSLCRARASSPPYPIGDPLMVELGDDAIVKGNLPDAMKTFVQVSNPTEGELSLAVGLGRVDYSETTSTIHSPRFEEQGFFGPVETTYAEGGLGTVFKVPNAPLREGYQLRVVADVTIGYEMPRPYYLLVPMLPGRGVGGLHAGVYSHLLVMGSEGDVADVPGTFLQHDWVGLYNSISVPPRHFLRFDQAMPLSAGTTWVYVGLVMRAWAQRWWIGEEPPLVERTGFIGIDLRHPAGIINLPAAHQLLDASGPVTLQSLRLTFCPPDPGFHL